MTTPPRTTAPATPADPTAAPPPGPGFRIPRPRGGGAGPAPARARRDWVPYALAGVLFVAYALQSLLRYRRMETLSWDLGIFTQAISGYAHLQAPVADLKGPGSHILGDHFSPITALLAPFYRLFPSPVTLLVAQALLFALAAVPVTRAATRLLGRARGLAIGAAFGLSWGVQRAVDFDFHEICFAVPLIAFSLEALLARRWKAALWWALPLCLVKEDLGVTTAAIALVVAYRVLRTSSRTAGWALLTAALGLLVSVLAFTVVIPAFNTSGGYGYWDKLGEGGPLDGWDTKVRTLLWILVPTTGLLALRSPLVLAALPTIGWRFLSHDDHYWSTDWHYSAVLMPVLVLALADAIDLTRRSPRPWLRSYALQLPTAVAAAALALTPYQPLSALTDPATYRRSEKVARVEELLARIPDGASVESDVGPIARLVSRCRVFWVGGTKGVVPDWIALDNGDGWAGPPVEYAKKLHPHARYTLVDRTDGYVLLKRAD
ncbi:DUF2079 domain-containing protein [Streptomyces sp. NPDC093225]|uniref:DUF2079 domain-containing protein n=1 Tax=Streptomyces sp. NPDC093225 TaxID=3366034 RepID=UPI00380C92C6